MVVGAVPGQVEAQVAQVEAQAAQVELPDWQLKLLDACSPAARSGRELLDAAGYRSRTGNFKKGLQRLIENRLLELTIPDKPNSRLQKYRLTAAGREAIKGRVQRAEG